LARARVEEELLLSHGCLLSECRSGWNNERTAPSEVTSQAFSRQPSCRCSPSRCAAFVAAAVLHLALESQCVQRNKDSSGVQQSATGCNEKLESELGIVQQSPVASLAETCGFL